MAIDKFELVNPVFVPAAPKFTQRGVHPRDGIVQEKSTSAKEGACESGIKIPDPDPKAEME